MTIYVRDVNLDKKLEDKYIPNTIILERDFTDVVIRIMKMKTTHGFVILFNHMVNVSQVVGDKKGSKFLILDKYAYMTKRKFFI